jgi:hypothetical protein
MARFFPAEYAVVMAGRRPVRRDNRRTARGPPLRIAFVDEEDRARCAVPRALRGLDSRAAVEATVSAPPAPRRSTPLAAALRDR